MYYRHGKILFVHISLSSPISSPTELAHLTYKSLHRLLTNVKNNILNYVQKAVDMYNQEYSTKEEVTMAFIEFTKTLWDLLSRHNL